MVNIDEAVIARLKAELDAAVTEVTAAEEALDAVLIPLRTGARAEKITITTGVEGAFVRVRSARAALAKVRELMDTALRPASKPDA